MNRVELSDKIFEFTEHDIGSEISLFKSNESTTTRLVGSITSNITGKLIRFNVSGELDNYNIVVVTSVNKEPPKYAYFIPNVKLEDFKSNNSFNISNVAFKPGTRAAYKVEI